MADVWTTPMTLPETLSDAATIPVIFLEPHSPVAPDSLMLCRGLFTET